MKIIVFASDSIKHAKYLTGGSMRSLQIISQLKSEGFDVEVYEPRGGANEGCRYEVSARSQIEIMKKESASLAYFLNASACRLNGTGFQYLVDVHGPIFYESALILKDNIKNQLQLYYSILCDAIKITCVSHDQVSAIDFLSCINTEFNDIFTKKVYCVPLDFSALVDKRSYIKKY